MGPTKSTTSKSIKPNQTMEDLLQKTDRIEYEKVNTFNNGSSPCYYVENDFGYVVFFIFPGGVVDFGIYGKKKKSSVSHYRD